MPDKNLPFDPNSFDPKSEELLENIKSSIANMQNNMQSAYMNLSSKKISAKSNDESVEIVLTATYGFEDIVFDNRALQGGVTEFKKRIREAFTNVIKKVQETTQEKTLELLQQMQIPDEIRNLSGGDGDAGGKK